MSQLNLFDDESQSNPSSTPVERKGHHYRWHKCGCLYGSTTPSKWERKHYPDCPECAKWRAHYNRIYSIYYKITFERLLITNEGWDYGSLEDYCALDSPLFWDVMRHIRKWIMGHVYNEKTVAGCVWGCCNK